MFTLPKKERIHGTQAVSRLLAKGRYGYHGALKYCWLYPNGEEESRMMVSVSKRFFKRAVKRNLLKRRLRESYRLQKDAFPSGLDIMFVYNTKEILESREIYALVGEIAEELKTKVSSDAQTV
ncbi:MAG: ribonuclease P protein component [Bacteroidales bacterium]|nr:ribonuclease P protein component [Bacteroidales bacterium]MCR5244065.1 ribonuclease P protein component [Bacteroidales bacterium]